MQKGQLTGHYWDTAAAFELDQLDQLIDWLDQHYPLWPADSVDKLQEAAIELIGLSNNWPDQLKAIVGGKSVLIYGDYDADGVISSFILSFVVKQLGGSPQVYLPNRYSDGYGINLSSLKRLSNQLEFDTVITIDNGIQANQVIDYLKQQGKLVGVIDHHQAKAKPSADVVIHHTATCAAGLAFSLALVMYQQGLIDKSSYRQLLQLGAVAILADQMPLNAFNYQVVKAGLRSFNQDGVLNLGLSRLLAQANWRPPVSETTINYIIAPRLNAPGRLGSPRMAYQLLNVTNPIKADQLVDQIRQLNQQRQNLTKTYFDLFQQDDQVDQIKHLVCYHRPDIPEGITGLLASKIHQATGKIALVVAGQKQLKGSGRGPAGFNLTAYLRRFNHLLTSLGGHERACGFSLEINQLDKLKTALEQQVVETNNIRQVNLITPTRLILSRLVTTIEKRAPFGPKRARPVVLVQPELSQVSLQAMGQNGQHTKLRLNQGDPIEIVAFNVSPDKLSRLNRLRLITTPSINHYNGRQIPQLKLIDLI